MFNKVLSGTLHGVEGRLITVEADVSDGLPAFNMVGFLASEVREASDRVRTALKNSDFRFLSKKITINLSPADVRKEGSAFDLPISIALLASYGLIPEECIDNILFIGELSLSGELKAVHGILSIIDHAKLMGVKTVILPYDNRKEAAIVSGITVYGARTLRQVFEHLTGVNSLAEEPNYQSRYEADNVENLYSDDFSDVLGQDSMKRATEIAVAGMHNLLFIGPPGAGKSMIAKRIPTIMPGLNYDESVELTKIYSVKGLLEQDTGIMTQRPFRAPHHSITSQSLIGGGSIPKPGEITLAHNGVLFLDEMLEFQKNTLEMLRQPVEDGKVTISRIHGSYIFPCRFMLVGAMNPCPCGYYPDRLRCHCTVPQIERYLRKFSQPMLDRMDMCVQVKRIDYNELYGKTPNDKSRYSSVNMRKRIIEAQKLQEERLKPYNIRYNSYIPSVLIDEQCRLGKDEEDLRRELFERYMFTARGMSKILKVSRTIADMEGTDKVNCDHILEALSYRINDFNKAGEGI